MCLKTLDNCGCQCHRTAGVKHIVACCDKPTYEMLKAQQTKMTKDDTWIYGKTEDLYR